MHGDNPNASRPVFSGNCTNPRGICDTEHISDAEVDRLLRAAVQMLSNAWHRYVPELAADAGIPDDDGEIETTDWLMSTHVNYTFVVKWMYRLSHNWITRNAKKHECDKYIPLLMVHPPGIYENPLNKKEVAILGNGFTLPAKKFPLSIVSWSICSTCSFYKSFPERESTEGCKVYPIFVHPNQDARG